MVTSEPDPNIDGDCPLAEKDGYKITSESDTGYNCIAWATGKNTINWWPTEYPCDGLYWPDDVPPDETLESFIAAYQTENWVDCGLDGSLEVGFEKLAIYVGSRLEVRHAARQLSDGTWTSKLGQYKDIEHSSPAGMECKLYGNVARYMKRPLANESSQTSSGDPALPDVRAERMPKPGAV